MAFEDHFSKQAVTYAKYRPQYPVELYAYLSGQTPEHELAWDCATGSGQAARGLVDFYEQVIATDASAEQIRQAEPHERVEYRVEPAEKTSLTTGSVDLVTVAVAVHWFDFDRFYQEVRRVLKPDGIIALWTYHRPQITPEVDRLVAYFETEVLDGYWPERIHYLREHYQTLPFPFEPVPSPEIAIHADWTLAQLFGFFNSWSAVRRYEEKRGTHPLKDIWEDFMTAWGGETQTRHIHWPLHLRVGRVG